MDALRSYQEDAVCGLRRAVSEGSRAPLLQMATGLGKTVVACQVIKNAVDKGKSVLVIVPRRQLVFQTSEKLDQWGVPHGIIMSGEKPSFMPNVQVASVQTLYRRCFENGRAVEPSMFGGIALPPAKLLIIDEAHANYSQMAQRIIAQYPNAVRIGMTATPCRAQGEGLGKVYDSIVSGPSVRWAMNNGFLSELRYFGPSEWDVSSVKIQAGDYNQKQLSKAVNKAKLIGDVVTNWERIGKGRTTVVFAVDRKHARALHEEFINRGHRFEYIDGQTDAETRHGIFSRLESSESEGLVSVAVVDMGWDMPCASCAVLARPTKSVARYLQAVGRILRPAKGKTNAILIDHTGAVGELGFVDDDFAWTLEGSKKAERKKTDGGPTDEVTITCPGCTAVIKPKPMCPECGMELKQTAKRAIEAHEAELVEIDRKAKERHKREWTMDEKAKFYAELKAQAKAKGYKPGWAAWTYRERLGVWPNDPRLKNVQPSQPSAETLAWLKHLQIKKAKRKEKERRVA